MKYYIIAGEPSGDLHGSNLMKAIVRQDSTATFRYWGGDHMTNVADGRVTHIRDTSIMGFVEVIKNISRIRQFFKIAKKTIRDFKPDRVILIDYPGFNLRMAKWAKINGYHTTYYISPQLWAWKKGRVKTVKAYVDHMLCILPFETAFYQQHQVKAHYVGHPLLPVIDNYRSEMKAKVISPEEKKVLAILPGSRKQEVQTVLPVYLQAAQSLKASHRIVIAGAPNIDMNYYHQYIDPEDGQEIEIVENDTYGILTIADLAIVTSGTATLETALFEVPQVVCYQTSAINYAIGKRLVDLKYISLVNLILNEGLIPELIQHEMTASGIATALQSLSRDRPIIKKGYQSLRQKLTTGTNASEVAATIIVNKNQASL